MKTFETGVGKGPGEKQKEDEKEGDEKEAGKKTKEPPISLISPSTKFSQCYVSSESLA